MITTSCHKENKLKGQTLAISAVGSQLPFEINSSRCQIGMADVILLNKSLSYNLRGIKTSTARALSPYWSFMQTLLSTHVSRLWVPCQDTKCPEQLSGCMGCLEFETLQPQDDHDMKSAHKHSIVNTLYILISIHISYCLLSNSENTFFFLLPRLRIYAPSMPEESVGSLFLVLSTTQNDNTVLRVWYLKFGDSQMSS